MAVRITRRCGRWNGMRAVDGKQEIYLEWPNVDATICRQYVKILHTRQKHGKFSSHNCRTTARPTKNRLTRLVLRQLVKMMFPGLHCIAEPSQFISWKCCHGTMTTILPPSNFNVRLTHINTHHCKTKSTYITRVKLCNRSSGGSRGDPGVRVNPPLDPC